MEEKQTWKVLSHQPIEKVTENLWRVEGEIPGMQLRRVMTLVKRHDGSILAHSAIALDEASMAEIDAWGKISWIVVPNGWHRIDAPRFKARYPQAKVICPSVARKKVEEVVVVDGHYEDFPSDDEVKIEMLSGVANKEGVLLVQSGDGQTAVFNDVIFDMPHLPGFYGFVLKHITASSGGPCVSRIGKLMVVHDKESLRKHLERIAALPKLQRLIVSHHRMTTGRAGEAIAQALSTL